MRLGLLALTACGRIGFDPAGDAGLDDDAMPMVTCPSTYQETPTGCYRVVASSELSWIDSELACEADGGHLVVISDAQELAQVTSLLPSNIADAFIGGSDRITPGVYLTVTGDLAFTPWGIDEPDPDEACMEVRNGTSETTRVFDGDCVDIDDYICEIDGIAPDPTAF